MRWFARRQITFVFGVAAVLFVEHIVLNVLLTPIGGGIAVASLGLLTFWAWWPTIVERWRLLRHAEPVAQPVVAESASSLHVREFTALVPTIELLMKAWQPATQDDRTDGDDVC